MHFRSSALLILLAVGAVVSVTVAHQGRTSTDRKKASTSGRLRARLEVSHCGEHSVNMLCRPTGVSCIMDREGCKPVQSIMSQ